MRKKTASQELIVRLRAYAKAHGRNPTNYAVAKLLGTTDQRISNWWTGRTGMADDAVTAACELLWPGDQMMLSYWLTRRQAELAPPEQSRAWRFVVDQVSQNATVREGLKKSAAAVILAAGVGFGGIGAPPSASADIVDSKYYGKYRRRRLQSAAGPLPACETCIAYRCAA